MGLPILPMVDGEDGDGRLIHLGIGPDGGIRAHLGGVAPGATGGGRHARVAMDEEEDEEEEEEEVRVEK